uniref:(northern house mosquito) hypothetical protein n=1 Tax=Culex pipiens TaxID=7175 RepID=A0A8D8B5I7_CULPI
MRGHERVRHDQEFARQSNVTTVTQMRRGTSSAATSERARVVRLKVAKVAPRITGVTMSPLVLVWRALPRASLRAAPPLSSVANRWRGWRKSESPTRTRRITWLCRSVYVREQTATDGCLD